MEGYVTLSIFALNMSLESDSISKDYSLTTGLNVHTESQDNHNLCYR